VCPKSLNSIYGSHGLLGVKYITRKPSKCDWVHMTTQSH
jgi:hypothetical protein